MKMIVGVPPGPVAGRGRADGVFAPRGQRGGGIELSAVTSARRQEGIDPRDPHGWPEEHEGRGWGARLARPYFVGSADTPLRPVLSTVSGTVFLGWTVLRCLCYFVRTIVGWRG